MSPNDKCEDGQTVYSRTVNIAVKSLNEKLVGTNYFPIFDKMHNAADMKQLKLPKREDLNEYQVTFLGAIGIDGRTQAEKDKELENSSVKATEQAKSENKNFSMNGLELLEQNISDSGRYIT